MRAFPTLDALDRKILAELQRDGRITNAELSDRVALSASACLRRVQRLERDGVIEGYTARLNAAALDRSVLVFVEITLTSQSEEALAAFETAVLDCPEIQECHLMAGTADYLLKIAVADTADFAAIHQKRLSRLPGVARMQSSFTLRTVVQTTALEL
ncbi:MAG: Lrp/AsnC ligand binding domain-containing protein [Pseudomonadota bacterium]